MAICASTCAPELPVSYTGGCGINTRNGGIKRLWFVKCDYEFTDIASDSEWTSAQTHTPTPNAVGSGLIMGQKGKGSFTKKRIASCMPESVVGSEKSITFQDYTTDPGGDCTTSSYAFWNQILTDSANYKMCYETCDGYVYGPINDFTIEIDEVIEDNNTGSTYLDGTVMWNNIDMLCPKLVSGGNGITPA